MKVKPGYRLIKVSIPTKAVMYTQPQSNRTTPRNISMAYLYENKGITLPWEDFFNLLSEEENIDETCWFFESDAEDNKAVAQKDKE